MTNAEGSRESGIAVYLGLGSNLGDRRANLHEAISRIKMVGLDIDRESSIYETEPVGIADQPWFLNQVIAAKLLNDVASVRGPATGEPASIATVQAGALLSELLKIEHEMGRQRTVANGPRVIDIDLLLFGGLIINHSKGDHEPPFMEATAVFVPHPRMHLRRFVLEPLCEISPEVVHPVLEKTCRELLAEIDDDSVVRIYEER